MNYQPRNSLSSRRNKSSANAVKTVIGVLLVLIVLDLIAPRLVPAFFSRIFAPIWMISNGSTNSQIDSLQQQVESQGTDASALALLEQENAELKTMLGRPPSKNTILGVVLRKPPLADYDSLIIDIGSANNTPGMHIAVGNMVYAVSTAPAIAAASASTAAVGSSTATSTATTTSVTAAAAPSTSVKVPIGLISEVYANTSKVDLFSSPGKTYNVEIGKNHIAVNASGRGAGNFEADIPRESGISAGDIVIVPSIEPLVFGTVTNIISDPANPYAALLFQSPVNIFSLHWIEVDMTPVVATSTAVSVSAGAKK